MHFHYIFLFALAIFQVSNAKVVDPVSDVTRKIHGSYGPFTDFKPEDCNKPHENGWMRCNNGESPAFAYHWNHQLKGCERVMYKGCGSTRNNFITERDCNNQAKPVCSK